MTYMGLCALGFFLFRHQLVEFFLPTDDNADSLDVVRRVGAMALICAAVFQLFDALGMVLIGALRGAGDTIWPGLATAALSWTVIVGGGALLAATLPHWGAIGPWVAASAYIILLGLLMAHRFARGPWRRMTLVNQPPPPTP